jgi:hypothetical protein
MLNDAPTKKPGSAEHDNDMLVRSGHGRSPTGQNSKRRRDPVTRRKIPLAAVQHASDLIKMRVDAVRDLVEATPFFAEFR